MIFIVAGGPKEQIPDLKTIQKENPNATWCGVDAGAKFLIENGITPSIAVGDFDSISNDQLKQLNAQIDSIYQLSPEKDQTDLEAALEFVSAQAEDDIIIFGATGGRFDHTYANIMITQMISKNRKVIIRDRQNEMRILHPGTYSFEESEMKYISFLSISEKVEHVTLIGMKYQLDDTTLFRKESLGVSNEITHHKGYISFEKGICLVVRSKD
ncbi:MAG: thiamine diphosphokinase [Bacillales bacterium]|jgi:thiamine pyrophosphokinase|nr:thiamine diphosphokinase [Bacillales bacterium]